MFVKVLIDHFSLMSGSKMMLDSPRLEEVERLADVPTTHRQRRACRRSGHRSRDDG